MMYSLEVIQPQTIEHATMVMRDRRLPIAMYKGGGMDLVDHFKEGLIDQARLVNLKTVRDGDLGGLADGRIGARATLAEIANSDAVRTGAPVIAQAAESAATPQVRNVATAAGNLLQRPRCWYYRNAQFQCLKKGGTACFAVDGENEYHAIFGRGPCYIVHPSNLAPALIVCNATVHLAGEGRDSIRVEDMFHPPSQDVSTEHVLNRGELITHITFEARPDSAFSVVKHKQSFDWPLVFACVALELSGSEIQSASVCAGAVAPTPWRLEKVENALAGVSVDDDAALRRACSLASEGAMPLSQNEYKVQLLPVAVRRAVLKAAGRPEQGGAA